MIPRGTGLRDCMDGARCDVIMGMTQDSLEMGDIVRRVHALVDRCRVTCLWFLREDYMPGTAEEMFRVIRQIEEHGDRAAYVEAREIREWLSRNSSTPSAG